MKGRSGERSEYGKQNRVTFGERSKQESDAAYSDELTHTQQLYISSRNYLMDSKTLDYSATDRWRPSRGALMYYRGCEVPPND